jgi:signal transduction histidine kinase
LRTPLTAIKGYGSMLLDGDFGKLESEKQVEAVRKMFISNNRLINLVENLLNISRIESGRLKFDFKLESLVQLVKEIYDNLKQNAEDRGLYLKFEEPKEDLPKVNMDSEKIRQIVINFIDNAIKYTKKGGITVSVYKKGNSIECCVADTGMGVSKEEQARLFRKFTRGKDAFLVNTEGMGLGLYVAQMMIQSHKGKIWVESPVSPGASRGGEGDGRGSRFCFSLPLA